MKNLAFGNDHQIDDLIYVEAKRISL